MIELGQRYRDRITGFIGTATSRTEYLNGCITIGLEPAVKDDGKLEDATYFDEDRLVDADTGQDAGSAAPRGGPVRRGSPTVRR